MTTSYLHPTKTDKVFTEVAAAKNYGVTVKEMRKRVEGHHGSVSGSLSRLHKEGRLTRLRERREGSSVYVLPEYVNGREEAPQGRQRTALTEEENDALSYVRSRISGRAPETTIVITVADLYDLVKAVERLS